MCQLAQVRPRRSGRLLLSTRYLVGCVCIGNHAATELPAQAAAESLAEEPLLGVVFSQHTRPRALLGLLPDGGSPSDLWAG